MVNNECLKKVQNVSNTVHKKFLAVFAKFRNVMCVVSLVTLWLDKQILGIESHVFCLQK